MRKFLLHFIFLIVIAFIGKLEAHSTIQCIERREDIGSSGCGTLIISSDSYTAEGMQEKNNIFKSTIKRVSDILFSTFSRNFHDSVFKLNNPRHKWGFITGYGNQKKLEVSYTYEVVFFQFQYYYSLLKKKAWSLEVLLQPQYNVTKYKNGFLGEEKKKGHEFGLNIGFLARKNIVKDLLNSYILISAGPHYVSGTPERQTAGFIFSDNLFAGISVRVFKSVYLDIRGGFRHISNAGIKNPNKGVNNLIINEGFFLSF